MEYSHLSPDDRMLIQDLIDELHAANQEHKVPEVLISCAEAARYLGVTPNTISSYIKQHRLFKHTVNRVTGIWLSDIVSFKSNH